MPSGAANGPHALGTTHTCSIGVLPAFDDPGGHVPLIAVNPDTVFCVGSSVRHRSLCTCHCVSAPPTSGASLKRLLNGSMYSAAALCCVPFRTSQANDAVLSGPGLLP